MVKMTKQALDELKSRLAERKLEETDVNVLTSLIDFNSWVQQELEKSKLTIDKLRKFYGFKRERLAKDTKADEDDERHSDTDTNSATDESDVNATDGNDKKDKKKKPQWSKDENHGRLSAADYTGLAVLALSHVDPYLAKGKCPDCAANNTDAKLISLEPRFAIILESQPLIAGVKYQRECSKCSICEKYFTAPLPANIEQRPKYDYSCYTQIAVWHYYGGTPFNRLEFLQKAQGVPLPDATQSDLMKKLYQRVGKSVIGVLRELAANSNKFMFDDTPGRIIEQMVEAKQSNGKVNGAIHSTALLAEHDGHTICLFETNKNVGGKTFKNLLQDRTATDKFLTMSDASKNNFEYLEENLMVQWIICMCLVHGRRKFYDLLPRFGKGVNKDTEFVLDVMSQVYDNERYCKQNKFNDEKRLIYHQKHSGPVMVALHTWLSNLLVHKQVEPNSRFGEAIQYLLKHWKSLTQFLCVAGAPIDNNPCERVVKIIIRYRNNSKFYRTFFGAEMGDAFMSIIHTAVLAGADVFDYLNQLQIYEEAVKANPNSWLPWNYRQTIEELQAVA